MVKKKDNLEITSLSELLDFDNKIASMFVSSTIPQNVSIEVVLKPIHWKTITREIFQMSGIAHFIVNTVSAVTWNSPSGNNFTLKASKDRYK